MPENSKGKSANLFPAILKTIIGNQKRLHIFGKDWPTQDGTLHKRLYSCNGLAHVAALRFLLDNRPQNIALNIGTGKGTSVLK